MTSVETVDEQDTHGRAGNHHTAIQFKRFEAPTTQWTINDVFSDDPLLKPVAAETNLSSSSSSV